MVLEIKKRKTSTFTSFVFQDLLPLVLSWEQAFDLLAMAFINFIDGFPKPHK